MEGGEFRVRFDCFSLEYRLNHSGARACGRVSGELGLAMADSWTKEFQEAARVAEEIEGRDSEKNALPPHSSEGTRIVSVTRRKLAVLNNKLDRLESLLQSAPLKGSL